MIPLQLPLSTAEAGTKAEDIDALLNDLMAMQPEASAEQYHLLYVGAHWCAPCKGLRPVLINILAKYPQIMCREINLDEQLSYQQSTLLRSLPALILYRGKKPIRQINGLVGSEKIHQLLNVNQSTSTCDSIMLAADQLSNKIQCGDVAGALSVYSGLNHDIKYDSRLQQIKSRIDLILESKRQLEQATVKTEVQQVYELFAQSLISQGLDLLLQLPVDEDINRQLYVQAINTLTDRQKAKDYRQQIGYFD